MMNEQAVGQVMLSDGRVVEANQPAARLFGLELDAFLNLSQEEVLAMLPAADRRPVGRALEAALHGEQSVVPYEVCLGAGGQPVSCLLLIVTQTTRSGRTGAQLILVDQTRPQPSNDWMQQNIKHLQILHDIDRDILASRDEGEIVRAALSRIGELVPDYRASTVLQIGSDGDAVLASDPPGYMDWFGEESLLFGELGIEIQTLRDGLPFIVHDFSQLESPRTAQRMMLAEGIRSYLTLPLRRGGELIGVLGLASGTANIFQAEHVQIAQEVADSLSVVIQNARLRRAEQQRQREAEVMRDVMAALAGAGDIKSMLEALLVHLHGLIHYDRAGLFLVDENQRFVPAERSSGPPSAIDIRDGEAAPAMFPENDPLVAELRRSRRPLVVADAQADPRFALWPELRAMRGWLGAPLIAGDTMLGFLSLGSLRRDAYTPSDADTMGMFAIQVAQVLQRAWQGEQSRRRTEELEVLTSISSTLGQVERGENTLAAIIEQLGSFFGANRGMFLSPDREAGLLVVKASQDERMIGLVHPIVDDWLWQALEAEQVSAIVDVASFVQDNPSGIYPELFADAQSAVAIPLKADQVSFGMLLFVFDMRRKFSNQNIQLFSAVAEIAAASLRRAVMLEALEQQVSIRTQHLSTLYHINALAGEPRNLLAVLEDILYVTIAAMSGSGGTVHFLEEQGEMLSLVAQNGLPADLLPALDELNASDPFWHGLLSTTSPLVIADIGMEANLPIAFRRIGREVGTAYIGAPIRAKNQALGVLSLYGQTIQDYSIEDITLLLTIADQVGEMVERARLMKQAELAAVVQERQRLARELHDSVTQLLYSQALFSGAATKVLRKGDQALAEQHLARIEQAAQQALREMRLLVYELRPSNELDEGLVDALERRLNTVEKRTGINVRFIRDGLPPLDKTVEMGIYRIAEEALNNTLKHGGASSVTVTVRTNGDILRLEVLDDGRGFDPQRMTNPGGMGLTNIQERAAALGGQAQVISAPGQGTRVLVEVKLAQAQMRPPMLGQYRRTYG